MTQQWSCERCHSGGVVRYSSDESIESVRTKIALAHSKANSICGGHFGMASVRVAA